MTFTKANSAVIIFLLLQISIINNLYAQVKDTTIAPTQNDCDSVILQQSLQLVKQYQYNKAATILEKLIEVDSSQTEAKIHLENVYFKMSRYQSAIKLHDQLLAQKTDTQYYQIRKALALEKIGQTQKAKNIFLKAYEADTTNWFITTQLGDLYKSTSRKDSAIYYYRKSCAIQPNSMVISKALSIYLKTKKYEPAYAFFNQFYQDDFKNNHLLFRLYGKVLYNLDSISMASHIYKRLYAEGDSSLVTTKFLGMCYWKQEKFEEAIPVLDQYVSMDSTDFQGQYILGSSLVHWPSPPNLERGKKHLKLALDLLVVEGTTLNLIYNEIAFYYQQKEEYDKELETYITMLNNVPESKYVRFKMATLYDYSLQNKTEALKQYEDLLAIYQKDSTNRQAGQIEEFCITRIEALKEEEFWK